MNKDLLTLVNTYNNRLSFKDENDYKIYNQFILNVKNNIQNKTIFIHTPDYKKQNIREELNKDFPNLIYNPPFALYKEWCNHKIVIFNMIDNKRFQEIYFEFLITFIKKIDNNDSLFRKDFDKIFPFNGSIIVIVNDTILNKYENMIQTDLIDLIHY